MEQKLRDIFSQSLGIDPSKVVDSLRYAESPQWDSIAHMSLIASIEEGFDIMIDAEDVIDMSSFEKAKQIVAKYLA
jgi:acyl carrier protein